MDDIGGSYYLQAKGAAVVFGKASVYQGRNVHDLVVDMRQEYLGYENNLQLVDALAKDPEAILGYLPGRSSWAFNLYKRHFPARIQSTSSPKEGRTMPEALAWAMPQSGRRSRAAVAARRSA